MLLTNGTIRTIDNNEIAHYNALNVVLRQRFQFRAEFFNLFNTPSYGNPGASLGTASFGSVTGAQTTAVARFNSR